MPRVAGHGVGCAVATSFARVWVARGVRARVGIPVGRCQGRGVGKTYAGAGAKILAVLPVLGTRRGEAHCPCTLATDLFSPS